MKVTNEQSIGRDVARNFRQLNSELETVTTDVASIDTRLIVAENLGVVGRATKTANQGSITTIADVTGLSVTFNATSTRLYKLTAKGLILSSIADDICQMAITDSSNNIVAWGAVASRSAGFGVDVTAIALLSGLSGSVTYKVRAARQGGTGTVTFVSGTTNPAYLVVEDIGLA